MITISNISFFRFCWKNTKLDWPKCARTLNPGEVGGLLLTKDITRMNYRYQGGI